MQVGASGGLILIGLSLEIVKLILAFSCRNFPCSTRKNNVSFRLDLIILPNIGLCSFSKESAYIVALITPQMHCAFKN